jgi:hypothetical protein
MSTIAAGTTSGTALVSAGDTTGTLVLQTNGTTTAVTIGTNQVMTLVQPLPVGSGGTGGSATPTAGGVVYGTGTVQAVTAAGTAGQYLQSNAGSAPTWVTAPTGGFTLATPVASTSGTSIDFTSIPAGVKQIVINFNGVSTNGVDNYFFQLGDAGGIETTGYLSACSRVNSDALTLGYVSSTYSFVLLNDSAASVYSGSFILTLENSSLFTWCANGAFVTTSGSLGMHTMSGRHTLSQELNQIRVTTAGGTQTFDLGEINIAYM